MALMTVGTEQEAVRPDQPEASSPARDHPPEPARWNIEPAMTGWMEHRAGWTSGQTRHSHDQASPANVI
jgi:hypothetical protein